ncbi:MAG: Bug family tripartite tricarboxylate transporter substrate binding protein [Alphaproteobacteria bacterium]|jgi:tripartite-type tricarboxylate transporter receptor subunit TctC
MTDRSRQIIRTTLTAGVLAGLGLGLMAPSSARAAGDDYFAGKQIRYIIATTSGGGYDYYARLVTRHMRGYLKNMKFVVINRPGAGHVIGANLIYMAKPDGLTIGTFNTGLIYAQLIKRKGIRFDLTKMSWIGKAAADPRMVATGAKLRFKSIMDFKGGDKTHKFGAAGIGSAAYNEAIMLSKAFDLNIQLIPGYGGTHSQLGIMRGEIVGMMGGRSSVRNFVDAGKGRYVLQVGGTPVAGVPQAKDVATDADGKAIVALISSQAELARFTAGPPGMNAAALGVLRAAYKKALLDPKLRAEAKAAKRPIKPGFGEDIAKRVRGAFKQTPATIALLKKVLAKKAPTNMASGTKLLTKTPDGRWITFKHGSKTIKSKISGSRTKITVGGKKAKRKSLKVGMVCDIAYKKGKRKEPKTIKCK